MPPEYRTLRKPTQTSVRNFKLESGLSIWQGTVFEEYLPEFKSWQKAYKIYTQMKDDAVIGTLLESVTVPLLDAKFRVDVAGEHDDDKRAAEWIWQNLMNNHNFSWLDHVEDALEFLPYGWMIAEKVLENDPKGGMQLSDIVPIGHETLYKWGKLDKHGRVTGFIQYNTGSDYPDQKSGFTAAPIEKLLHLTFRPRKRNPQGKSLLRAVYRAWYFKSNFEVIEGIGAERDVGNVPVAVLGEGYYSSASIDKIEEILKGIRIDETASMVLPHGTEIKPFGSGGKVYNLREIIRDYGHIIRQRFFMDFVSLGAEQVGTQALAKEVTGFFSLALGSIQRQMIEAWNKQLVEYMFKWNPGQFPDRTGLPKLVWSKPGKLNVQALASAVSSLVSGEIIHYNKPLEHHIREVYELPPITDEEIDELETEKKEQQLALPEGGPTEPNNSQGRGNPPSSPPIVSGGNVKKEQEETA